MTSKPRRINLVLGPFLSVPPAPAGAVERVWVSLAEEFVRKGMEVNIVARSHPAAIDNIAGQPSLRLIRGAPFRQKLSRNLLADAAYSIRVLATLPAADVTVTNCTILPLLLRTCKKRAGKVVVHVARMPKGQMRLYRLSGVSRFATVSRATARAIASEDPTSERLTRVIPNPIDTSVFRANSSELSNTLAGPPTILYVGRIHPEKGLEILVRALALLSKDIPNVRLRMVGPAAIDTAGAGLDYVESLKRLAGSLEVSIEAPVYDRQNLCELIRTAHAFCYPSIAEAGETFGVAPLEAIACGVPTVTSSLECFSDYLISEETGLIFDHRVPNCHVNLAESLRRLLLDSSLRERVSRNGAATAKRYSIESIAQMYLEDFEQLCG